MNVMISAFLYGVEYAIHVFIHDQKQQIVISMFSYGGQTGITNPRSVL